jgi:DNA-binding CsgD family transcriptional regulator
MRTTRPPARRDSRARHRERGVLQPEGASRELCLGREAELALLGGGLADAQRGRGRLFLLRGEAGIGKTRLAQELAARASSANGQVLWGRCSEQEGAPAFWPWIQVLRSCVEGMDAVHLREALGLGASWIAAIVPEIRQKLRNAGPPADSVSEASRFRLFDAVRTFLDRASLKRPLVVVLDDLHWADHASLLLLEFVAKELGHLSMLIVGTSRDGEPPGPLAQTLGELARCDLQTLHVGGLMQADVELLMTAPTGASPPEALVRLVHARTGGNPFFITEIARSLEKNSAGFSVPDSVKSALARRLLRLSDLANQLLLVASVIGREFEVEILERMFGDADRGQLLHALEEGLQALIIEPAAAGEERYQFRHALIRDALYEDLLPSHRARWHARVTHALEDVLDGQVDERAPELALHAARAGRFVSSDKPWKYSTIAGQQMLAVHAQEQALPHFERAWKLKQHLPMDADAVTILVGLGYAQAATAHRWNRQEAWDNLRRALEHELDSGHVAQAVSIATHACITPESADGVAAVVQRVLGLVTPGSREEGWLRSRWGAASYFETADYRSTQAAFDRALAIAAAHADAALESRTLAHATVVDHFHFRWQDVLSKSRPAIELARRVEDLYAETYARYRAAYALIHCGSSDEARLEVRAALACAERLGDRGLLGDALYTNAVLAQVTGDWHAARADSDRGLALWPFHMALLHARMLLEYETGNVEAGTDYLRRWIDTAHLSARYPLIPVFVALGISQARRLAKGVAEKDLAMARATLQKGSPLPMIDGVAWVGRALFALDERKHDESIRALEGLRPFNGRMLVPLMMTDRVSGLLAHAVSRITDATCHFENALTFCRRARYRPELAWTCFDYARLLLESGGRDDRQKASDLLQEAHAIASELDMRPLLNQVVAFEARYRSRLIDKPAGLTDREIAILHLLVHGKANKEIAQELDISVNTVAVHVAHILRKTGSSNRTEAVAFANREHLVGATAH